MTLKWLDPVYFLYGIITVVYFLNIDGNAIWTTHESYYAEAVREMHESGVYSEFFFNYEPRFQKPPMTYWLMAASTAIFGINEFGLRLPFVLMSLATIYLVFAIGNLLYSRKSGIYGMLIFSVSLQFIWFKHYASPEIPLTFFFTLAAFLFLKGFRTLNKVATLFSYVIIGLAALTKGFPYLLIFFLIIAFWGLVQRPSNFFVMVKKLALFEGVLISVVIGMSWAAYMAATQGAGFTDVLISETFGRVFNHPDNHGFLGSLLYYPEAVSWGFFPFSFLLLVSLFHLRRKVVKELGFLLIWVLVFLVVFTISDGKLPIYLLQAFPALGVICGHVLTMETSSRSHRIAIVVSLFVPAAIALMGSFFLVDAFDVQLHWLILVGIVSMSAVALYIANAEKLSIPFMVSWLSALILYIVIFVGVMPAIEKFRPYSVLEPIFLDYDKSIPLYTENRFLDNMPYYAARKVVGGLTWTGENIIGQKGNKLILIEGNRQIRKDEEILWTGLIHGSGAEDHFFKFIRDCHSLHHGDSAMFTKYTLLYKFN